MTTPIFGLILAGGASTRMQRDKAALTYQGRTQLERAYEVVSRICPATFVSVRADQRDEPTRAQFPQIVDRLTDIGPLAGIAAGLQQHPKAAWLIVACDLPFLDEATLEHLIAQRDAQRIATAYRSAHDGLPEPLCAIWEPAARSVIDAHLATNKQCPRKLLINADCKLIELPNSHALDNINTPDEFTAATAALATAPAPAIAAQDGSARALRTFEVQYFAVLREQAGCSDETIESDATCAAELYAQLKQRHGFKLERSQLKVAVNSEFSDWNAPLQAGDAIVFIPPVAGG